DGAGRVVERGEDDAPARPDRRGLRGDLDAGDQDLAPVGTSRKVDGADHAQRVEQPVVEGEDVAADVHAEDVELRLHDLGGRHRRQLARRDVAGEVDLQGAFALAPADGELALDDGRAPGGTVQGADEAEQVAARDLVGRVDAVEGPGQREPLGGRAGDAGAAPEIGQRRVGAPGDDRVHLRVPDAPDLAQRDADPERPSLADGLDPPVRGGAVDVQ